MSGDFHHLASGAPAHDDGVESHELERLHPAVPPSPSLAASVASLELRSLALEEGRAGEAEVSDAEEMDEGGHEAAPPPPQSLWARMRASRLCLPLVALAAFLVVLFLLIGVADGWSPSSPEELSCTAGLATRIVSVSGTVRPDEPTPPDTIIAYVGDTTLQRRSPFTDQLYELIKSYGAHALVVQGDLDYYSCPREWDRALSAKLGDTFPVFAVAGDGDLEHDAWSAYSAQIVERWKRSNITSCEGLVGRQHVCSFRGVMLVQVAPGLWDNTPAVSDRDIAPFIERAFDAYPSRWRVCSWHKNQALMQTGGKKNDTGWGVYDACRRKGAMVATGHEHSYARTYLMSDFERQTISQEGGANATWLPFSAGRSMAFCGGLGGRSLRPDKLCAQSGQCPWFAAKVNSGTASGSPRAAALFCHYHVDGDPNRARCKQIDLAGFVHDEFVIDVKQLAA